MNELTEIHFNWNSVRGEQYRVGEGESEDFFGCIKKSSWGYEKKSKLFQVCLTDSAAAEMNRIITRILAFCVAFDRDME